MLLKNKDIIRWFLWIFFVFIVVLIVFSVGSMVLIFSVINDVINVIRVINFGKLRVGFIWVFFCVIKKDILVKRYYRWVKLVLEKKMNLVGDYIGRLW